MSRLRVAVIGGGHLGRIHTRIIQSNPQAELVGVADTCPESRQKIESELKIPVTGAYREWIDQIDAAIIATPTVAHYQIAVDLLNHGIHTFIEKPLTSTTPQADHLIQLADHQNLILQVGHVERFNPAFEQASRVLPGPRYLEAHRMSGFTMRSIDVGVVMDLMIHDIDLVTSLIDSPLVETRAIGVTVFGPHEDVAQARLEFANGSVANLTASRCSFQPTRTISWMNENGYVAADLAAGKLQVVGRSDLVDASQVRSIHQMTTEQQATIRDNLFEEVLPKTETTVTPHNAIEQEQIDFLHCVNNNSVPRVTGRHGRRAVSIAQSVLDAIEQHRWQDGLTHRIGAQGQRLNLLPTEEKKQATKRAA